MMKFVGVLLILSLARQYNCISHDSTVGFCSNILRNRTIPVVAKVVHKPNNKMFSYFRKTEVTIRFPEIGEFLLPITCIMMKDNATDGTGGFAMIKEGGTNFRHVVIYFKSQRGKDIRFSIDIFAEPYGGQPIYPGIQAQPAGWIYPTNTNYQQQYTFNRT